MHSVSLRQNPPHSHIYSCPRRFSLLWRHNHNQRLAHPLPKPSDSCRGLAGRPHLFARQLGSSCLWRMLRSIIGMLSAHSCRLSRWLACSHGQRLHRLTVPHPLAPHRDPIHIREGHPSHAALYLPKDQKASLRLRKNKKVIRYV